MSNKPRPQILDMKIVDIQRCHPELDTLLGLCWIGRTAHNAEFIRVAYDADGQQVGIHDAGEYRRFCNFSQGPFETIMVPGFDWQFICIIHPFDR